MEMDAKFHIHGKRDFTCRNGNSVRCRIFSITCDLHIKLVFCSWLQSWHSMCSTLTGWTNWGPFRACGIVIHECGIDNLCLPVRPWHCHTRLLDVGDVYRWGNFRIYAHHSSQVLWLFPIQSHVAPSVLWCCWLGGRKGIRPVNNWVVGSWRGICLERGADLHPAQLIPLPLTVSCFSKIQIGVTFLVPAQTGRPGEGPINERVYTVTCFDSFLYSHMLLH